MVTVASPSSTMAKLPEWQPSELGLGLAWVSACVLVAGLAAALAWVVVPMEAPRSAEPVLVHLVDPSAAWPAPTPAETAAPLAETAPPPDPARPPEPALDTSPAPSLPDLPSGIAVAAIPAAALPILQPSAPAKRRDLQHRTSIPHPAAPPPVQAAAEPHATARIPSNPAPTPPADTTSGLGPYQSGLHRQIERNMLADRAVSRLGVDGTAVIVASIAADGRLVSARVARSSGTGAIDRAALQAVERGGFAAFGPHMPAGPITISVPISVEAR